MNWGNKIKKYERKKKRIYAKIYKYLSNCKNFDIVKHGKDYTLLAQYLLKPREVEFVEESDEDFKQLKKDLKFVYENSKIFDNLEPQELELSINHYHRIILSFYLIEYRRDEQ